ncbi:DNA polymerase [Paramuricea clavata]|uniref:DNA-directed DNA polymerase n=1 Tax=Paramuricea clavata TaxID=317549 RepID=A0A7D9L9T6_PARCT|nr:DNA polymerase [Paramuricea clavata]
MVVNETFYTLRERTRRLTEEFKRQGYVVVEMWECDFIRDNKLTQHGLKLLRQRDFFINIHLNPRDALFGGRVSPAVMYAESGDKKIRYYDFTSLYPFVQKKYQYPTQHPTIIRGVENCARYNIDHIFGLIKCKILPPTNLLFPVLPYRATKLTFPLCRTCADTLCDACTHVDEEERILFGTWTSVEIQTALQHGYVIREIYEMYNYEHREKIFDTYVNMFIKLKQESSGVPRHCYDDDTGEIDDAKVNEYVAEYLKHEGVKLDANKITYNPGQRTVMKALLNSLWGKLAQNEDTAVVSFIDEFEELLQLVNDNSIDVTSLDFISDDVARTTHRKTGSLITLPNRNVVIASFATAYARLELFKILHCLQEDVLYYDTDSVIYVENVAKGHVLKTGSYLWQLTDELVDKKASEKWIELFSAAGPKAYSYRTNEYIYTHDDGAREKKRDEITHVKGFTLKGDTKKKSHLKVLRNVYEIEKRKFAHVTRNLHAQIIKLLMFKRLRKNFVLHSGNNLKCCTIPFEHPFMMMVCGPSQSGKSYFIENIIKNHEKLITPRIDKLIYLYTVDKYDSIKQHIRDNKQTSTLKTFEFIDCNQGIPSMEIIKEKLGENTLLVLDDLMVVATTDTTNLRHLNNIASRDSHHSNTFVIYVCQNLNFGSGKLRNCRVNSQYHIMCKSLTDCRDVEMIATNKKINQNKLHKILEDVGKKQYGYIVFDGCPKGYDNARVRTGIFPNDETVIYDV